MITCKLILWLRWAGQLPAWLAWAKRFDVGKFTALKVWWSFRDMVNWKDGIDARKR